MGGGGGGESMNVDDRTRGGSGINRMSTKKKYFGPKRKIAYFALE